VVGDVKVDLKKALRLLLDVHGADTVLVDTGRILGNLLIEKGLVSEMSLLVHPVIVGGNGYQMFGPALTSRKMELIRNEKLGKGLVWTVYTLGGGRL
jgi:2,5-diamino-6-(ribosylamino)-4(3H)-pyrimidinone 5'-phosphate reductase